MTIALTIGGLIFGALVGIGIIIGFGLGFVFGRALQAETLCPACRRAVFGKKETL